MPNTSATGGPLLPDPTPTPLEDDALIDFFQAWLVALTGLDGTLVRPRWQEEPPNIPDEGTTWVALGVSSGHRDVNAVELHVPSGSGYNETRRHEILHILTSFYGPQSRYYASLFSDGMQVAQNREVLSLNAMGLVESGDLRSVPELVKNKWYFRLDLQFTIRRQIVRKYSVQNLASAEVILDNEHYKTDIKVSN